MIPFLIALREESEVYYLINATLIVISVYCLHLLTVGEPQQEYYSYEATPLYTNFPSVFAILLLKLDAC